MSAKADTVGFKLECNVHVCACFEKLSVFGKTLFLQKWPKRCPWNRKIPRIIKNAKGKINVGMTSFHSVYGKIPCVPLRWSAANDKIFKLLSYIPFWLQQYITTQLKTNLI